MNMLADWSRSNFGSRLNWALLELEAVPELPKCLQRNPLQYVSQRPVDYSTPLMPHSRKSSTDDDALSTNPSTPPSMSDSPPWWEIAAVKHVQYVREITPIWISPLGKRKRLDPDDGDPPEPSGDAKRICYTLQSTKRRVSAPWQVALSLEQQDHALYARPFETVEEAYARHHEPARRGSLDEDMRDSWNAAVDLIHHPYVIARHCERRAAVGD